VVCAIADPAAPATVSRTPASQRPPIPEGLTLEDRTFATVAKLWFVLSGLVFSVFIGSVTLVVVE
jgi:hypothetical protein